MAINNYNALQEFALRGIGGINDVDAHYDLLRQGINPQNNPQAYLSGLQNAMGQQWMDQNYNAWLSSGDLSRRSGGAVPQNFAQLMGNPGASFGVAQEDDKGFLGQLKDFVTDPGVMMALTYGTAGGLTGAFSGAGAVGSGAGAATNPLLAGGGEVGSGYASSAALPQFGGGYLMPGASMPTAITPTDPTFGGALTQVGPGQWAMPGGVGAGTGTAALGGVSEGAAGASAGASGGASGAGGASGTAGGTAATGIFDKILSNPSILGAGAGALLGGIGGGSSPAGNVATTEEMPDWLKAYMKPALDKYGTELQNYQVDPYGIMAGAGKQFSDTVNGMYLTPDSNRYLQDYFNAGAERVKGTLSPSFGHMQAFGSNSGYNEALSRGLGDLATGIYGGAYENERNRQAQMTAAAPAFLTQNSQAAFAPYQSYLETLSGLGKQKTQPYFDNPFGNILGGAMAGFGLGNIFK